MWWLIKWLILGGCRHKWVKEDQAPLIITNDYGERTSGRRIILCCEKCGDFQKRDLI